MVDFTAFSYAFQPIIDVGLQTITSYEALVRGPAGESALSILQQFEGDDLLRFDGVARVRAVEIAAELGIGCQLNLNFLASVARLDPQTLDRTIAAAEELGLEPKQIVLEVSETDAMDDTAGFLDAIWPLLGKGVSFSLDDFGSAHSGLNLLAEFQPETIKLDLPLVRDIHRKGARHAIIRGVICTCEDLGIAVVAEGAESIEEYDWLLAEGIFLFHGYLFARPAFEQLPKAQFPL
jgi:blue light- and temperature-responsive anti-repressor